MLNLNKRGQSTLEYAVIIAVVVAGLIAMQVYMKRGVQGKLRQASDDIGEQFSPGYTTSSRTTSTTGNTVESTAQVNVGGETMSQTKTTSSQTQTHSGNEDVNALNQENWK